MVVRWQDVYLFNGQPMIGDLNGANNDLLASN
jgi:hypothetical protein